ncbi:MAG: hypothetical protein ABIP81_05915 [Terriglobales bacterium]
MPKLCGYALCNSVARDDEAHPTAINVFASISVGGSEAIPVNALSQRSWQILTMWQVDLEERTQSYEQVCLVSLPDGTAFGGGRIAISPTMSSHNLSMKVTGIPIGQVGLITVKVWLEQDGKKVTEEHSTWISVEHLPREKKVEGIAQDV